MSRNADSACPFLPLRQYKKWHAESAFRDACRTFLWVLLVTECQLGGCGFASGNSTMSSCVRARREGVALLGWCGLVGWVWRC